MYKTITGIRRKEGLSFEQFTVYWTDIHAKLVQKHADTLGIVKYVQLHMSREPKSEKVGKTYSHPRYDGIAEVWYESETIFRENFKSKAGQRAVREIVKDQKKFIGSNETLIFRGHELNII